MALRTYGHPGTQCEIVSYWVAADCCGFVPPICQQGAPDVPSIQAALSVGGIASRRAGRPLNFGEIQFEIDSGRPVIVVYFGSFSGHVVVIRGYDPVTNEVYINDPYYGQFIVPFGNTFIYGGNLSWVDTIYDIRP